MAQYMNNGPHQIDMQLFKTSRQQSSEQTILDAVRTKLKYARLRQ